LELKALVGHRFFMDTIVFIALPCKLILEGLKVEFNKDGCKVNNVLGTVVAQA
jgi:hypothetical protein